MDQHSANLRAAIADLRRRRDEIDRAIASMETILASVYGASVEAPPAREASTPERVFATGGNAYTIFEADLPLNRTEKVKKAFDEHPDRAWSTVTLADHIGESREHSTIKAIGAILSRMNAADEVERVGRGTYRSKNASAPGATGAEDKGESGSDSSLQEGGSHGSAAHDGEGDHARSSHDPHGHGDRRSAVVGGAMST